MNIDRNLKPARPVCIYPNMEIGKAYAMTHDRKGEYIPENAQPIVVRMQLGADTVLVNLESNHVTLSLNVSTAHRFAQVKLRITLED